MKARGTHIGIACIRKVKAFNSAPILTRHEGQKEISTHLNGEPVLHEGSTSDVTTCWLRLRVRCVRCTIKKRVSRRRVDSAKVGLKLNLRTSQRDRANPAYGISLFWLILTCSNQK
jgi:hypothetical protein